jgi:3D (Asp-Asp-Asp) domain-containing protein
MPMTRLAAAVLFAALLPVASEARPRSPRRAGHPMRLTATAYCHHGITESGAETRRGMIAADPRVLPVGSVVTIESIPRQYSGDYTVMDTGAKIKGHKIDIFIPNCSQARKFGRRVVVARLQRPHAGL